MFRSIDKECRGVASFACLLGVAVSVIVGIAIIVMGAIYHYPALQGVGVLYLIVAPVLSWLCVYLSYVFSALLGLARA